MRKKRDKRNKAIFSWSFRITIAVTMILLCICVAHDQMLFGIECALLSIWTVFSTVFTYAVIRKWEILHEEGFWKHHRVSKEEQWKASILLYVISLMITIGFLIDLVIKIVH